MCVLHIISVYTLLLYDVFKYRKPQTISQAIFDGLIQGGGGGLYRGGAYIGGGLIHGRSFVLVINKSDINKSVINRKINIY